MRHGDKISDTRKDQADFLIKIVHRISDDLDQVQHYAKGATLPDSGTRAILERVHLNLGFFLDHTLPKKKE